MTVVHETDHWFSLLHTDTGSCSNHGDHIDDTLPGRDTHKHILRARLTL